MTSEKKIKQLFDEKWVRKFLADRVRKYWPGIKKLLSVKIEILKIFLNYQRISLKYNLSLENSVGQTEQKEIIVKAQKTTLGFLWPRRIGEVIKDCQASHFLVSHGLKNLIPSPLDFFSPLNTYLYEAIPGHTFKKFMGEQEVKEEKLLSYLPVIASALKKVHSIKEKPFFASASPKKLMDGQFKNYLNLIKKYYPPGYTRFKTYVERLKKIRKKYEQHLFNRQFYALVHGDFQADNILIGNDNKIYLLDWADSNYFNPLDDLGSFFIQTELHLKYVLPEYYQNLMAKIKQIFNENYFDRQTSSLDQLQIDYFATKDILRIISFISFTEIPWQPIKQSDMMESLLITTEEKIKKLETNY